MGYYSSALWVSFDWDMMYRKTGGLRAGEGVVGFPGTPICQQCDRCGRVLWRGGILSRKRHAIQSASEPKDTLECV